MALLDELRRAPTLLALEDLQWADEASLDVLSLLTRRLDAVPVLVVVTYRDERGAKGLPRGPRSSTRSNPARLTSRELEVLTLLSAGLGNHEIAGRLIVSQRTVDHHVSAVLRKLGVHTRGQAAAEAARLGLAIQDR